MEEKVLIKSEQYDVKKITNTIVKTGVILSVILLIVIIGYYIAMFRTVFVYFIRNIFWEYLIFALLPVFVVTVVIPMLIYFWLHSYEMTVTDKRIYGKGAWGKRVDLPVDSVSAISTIRILKGVAVATSSGKIKFLVIKNSNAIYDVLNNLLIERKEKKNETATVTASNVDEAEQLKKYKDLLDSGVITQEEFDVKKKQLLGL